MSFENTTYRHLSVDEALEKRCLNPNEETIRIYAEDGTSSAAICIGGSRSRRKHECDKLMLLLTGLKRCPACDSFHEKPCDCEHWRRL